eukprot:GGOE01034295.1.p5 GENE.GGOE01034295.1~~GGOE01034295.1.p5  ORF type:complete len:134 (+),score=3.29 GGOE01034295.1:1472-1873(+)
MPKAGGPLHPARCSLMFAANPPRPTVVVPPFSTHTQLRSVSDNVCISIHSCLPPPPTIRMQRTSAPLRRSYTPRCGMLPPIPLPSFPSCLSQQNLTSPSHSIVNAHRSCLSRLPCFVVSCGVPTLRPPKTRRT